MATQQKTKPVEARPQINNLGRDEECQAQPVYEAENSNNESVYLNITSAQISSVVASVLANPSNTPPRPPSRLEQTKILFDRIMAARTLTRPNKEKSDIN